jgi:formylglycine-generating enzyme required for sulfatase activity
LLRGGGWDSGSTFYCRASDRSGGGTPDTRYFSIGFRVARNP